MNKKYKAVLFDFDGTIGDTFQGIFSSYNEVSKIMNYPIASSNFVNEAIGSKITDVFLEKFNMPPDKINQAVEIYRNKYATDGIFEVTLYDGMYTLLSTLFAMGFKLGIATLKKEQFAIQMLDYLNLSSFFSSVKGMNNQDDLEKCDIINLSIKELGVDKKECLFVGDSKFDAIGAEKSNVDFCAVTYGYGFKKVTDLENYLVSTIQDSPLGILNFLLNQ